MNLCLEPGILGWSRSRWWMTSWLLNRQNVLVLLPWITGPRLWLGYGAWLGRMTNHVFEGLAVTSFVGRQRRQVEIKKAGNFIATEEHARGLKRSAAQDVISKVVFFFCSSGTGAAVSAAVSSVRR